MIDALRGYAIAFVFGVHVIGPLVPWELGLFRIGGLPFSPLMPLHAGIYAVQLFFVLSGFVLYLPYAQGRRQMRSGRDVREYLWRRCTRLMPLFWLAVLVPMVLMFGWQPLHDRVGQLVPMLTMTFPFFQKTFYPQYNFTLWSLGIEFWLSLSLPLVVPLVRRFGIGRVVLGAILLSLCTRFAAMLTVRTFGFNVLMSGPFSQLDTFVFGVALAHLWVHPVASPKPLRDLLAGCTMLVIAGFMTDWVNLHVVPWGSSALTRLLVAAGMALMTHGLLWLDWKAIANPVARQAGRMCYSLYVWHVPVLVSLLPDVAGRTVPALCAYVAVLIAVATLSYRYVEFGHVADASSLFDFPRLRRKTPPPGKETASLRLVAG